MTSNTLWDDLVAKAEGRQPGPKVYAQMDDRGTLRYFADPNHTIPSTADGMPLRPTTAASIGIATSTGGTILASNTGPVPLTPSERAELDQLRIDYAVTVKALQDAEDEFDQVKFVADHLMEGKLYRSDVENHIADWCDEVGSTGDDMSEAEHAAWKTLARVLRDTAKNRSAEVPEELRESD